MTIYKGFSTYNRSKRFTVTDFDLVKQDIFNHFNIKKGEKLMQPGFGTSLWDIMFDPMDDNLRQTITDEIKAVCRNDPRVTVNRIAVTTYDHGVQVVLNLTYRTQNLVDNMILKFDQASQKMTMA